MESEEWSEKKEVKREREKERETRVYIENTLFLYEVCSTPQKVVKKK